ncbi:hypothetical protein M427DRAFT_161293 [Gonapodya prolifera JEL478]|uniref:F-box domain-containing protein n=1 Tax=Gonapodya prolifera (strain JEL478) TaxID=1344416 RepID=A0A138ZWS0_GONPJ|nr:hypothetical protein M427DRAFT_161293 [Gonapodya prolifera JEL478]|eukprot:KXS08904.1 hypothetical protein M427DRAFT_161293 [Gonapodya prolifera JEL478]
MAVPQQKELAQYLATQPSMPPTRTPRQTRLNKAFDAVKRFIWTPLKATSIACATMVKGSARWTSTVHPERRECLEEERDIVQLSPVAPLSMEVENPLPSDPRPGMEVDTLPPPVSKRRRIQPGRACKRPRSPSPDTSIERTHKRPKATSNPPPKPTRPPLPVEIWSHIFSMLLPGIRQRHADHLWYYKCLPKTCQMFKRLVDDSYIYRNRIPTTISIVPVDTAGTVRSLEGDRPGYNVLKSGHVLALKNSTKELFGPWTPVVQRAYPYPPEQRVHPREYYRTVNPNFPLQSDTLAKPLSRVEDPELIRLEADYMSPGEKWPRIFFPYSSSPLYVYWKEPKDGECAVWEPADLEELARRTLESQLGEPIILKIEKLVMNFALPEHIPSLLYYVPCTSTGLNGSDLRMSLFKDPLVRDSELSILAPREIWTNQSLFPPLSVFSRTIPMKTKYEKSLERIVAKPYVLALV